MVTDSNPCSSSSSRVAASNAAQVRRLRAFCGSAMVFTIPSPSSFIFTQCAVYACTELHSVYSSVYTHYVKFLGGGHHDRPSQQRPRHLSHHPPPPRDRRACRGACPRRHLAGRRATARGR